MRVLKVIGLMVTDILDLEPATFWTTWLAVTFFGDLYLAIYTWPDGEFSHTVHPISHMLFRSAVVLESIPVVITVGAMCLHYTSEKWEQTKTSENDKDTLLRGSKERV